MVLRSRQIFARLQQELVQRSRTEPSNLYPNQSVPKIPWKGLSQILETRAIALKDLADAALRVDKTAIGRQADFALVRQARTILGDIRRASAWTSSRPRQERLGFGPNAAYEIGRWLGSGERGALVPPKPPSLNAKPTAEGACQDRRLELKFG
jgi:hypothetical protein